MLAARSGRSRLIDPTPTITPPLRARASILAFCSFSMLIATAPPSLTISTQKLNSVSETSPGAHAAKLYSGSVFVASVWVGLEFIDVAASVVGRPAGDEHTIFSYSHGRGERYGGPLRVNPTRHTFRTRADWKHAAMGPWARCSAYGMLVEIMFSRSRRG
jgi:hypothetical protein